VPYVILGLLHAAKNAEKIESRFLDMVGGKKTKRRWYELDSEHFKWCSGHDKEADYKGQVKISTITDIRPYSTDSYVIAECQHCFEIETNERVYALGAETIAERENWMTALRNCRDNYLMSKGSYKLLQFHELSLGEVIKFSEMFKKQATNYLMISKEDLKHTIEVNGLDLSDVKAVSSYLVNEAIAGGNTSKLMKIFYELLLIPPGLDGIWDLILSLLTKAREKGVMFLKEEKKVLVDEGEGATADGGTGSHYLVEMLRKKFKEGNGICSSYPQVSKLALSSMNSEEEVKRLQRHISDLNKTVADLQQQLKDSSISSFVNPLFKINSGKPLEVNEKEQEKPSGGEVRHQRTANRSRVAPPPLPSKPSKSSEAVSVVTSSFPIPHSNEFVAVSSVPPTSTVSLPSPPVPVNDPVPVPVAAASSTSISSDPRIEKYEKMKKVLPEGAVRQKMNLDGFCEEEIDGFFNRTFPSASSVLPSSTPTFAVPSPSLPPSASDPRYEKFEKMKKILPEGAVRQKMTLEGFSENEIEAFLNDSYISSAVTATPSIAAAPSRDPKFEKYEKMKKMLPEGAVRQKMSLEGISEAEIDDFFNGTLNPPLSSASAPPSAAPDPRFEKYEKMRKMLPEGAVRQKMTAEGFSNDEIDRFFSAALSASTSTAFLPVPASPLGSAVNAVKAVNAIRTPPKPVEEEPPEGMTAKPKIKPVNKLRGLFWNKIKTIEIKETIWFKLNEYSLTEEEKKQLEEYFSNKAPTSTSSDASLSSPKGKGGDASIKLLSVLDGKRTQNILILLGKLKKSPEDVMKMIVDLDCSVLNQELTISFLENVPTPEGEYIFVVHSFFSRLFFL
jgi:hypothetical protein